MQIIIMQVISACEFWVSLNANDFQSTFFTCRLYIHFLKDDIFFILLYDIWNINCTIPITSLQCLLQLEAPILAEKHSLSEMKVYSYMYVSHYKPVAVFIQAKLPVIRMKQKSSFHEDRHHTKSIWITSILQSVGASSQGGYPRFKWT